MAKKSLQRARERAFELQNGRCFYCMQRMDQSPITKCTAEHLKARCDGGRIAGNIVAACLYCNNERHRAEQPMAHEVWRAYVINEVRQKRWPTLTSG